MKDDYTQILRFFYLFLHLLQMLLQLILGIKTLLANDLITFFISGNPVFSNGPSNLPRNPHDCIILDISVFDNLMSVDK